MKTISGKSSSLIRPSPLSSSRFTTIGVDATCADHGNARPAALGLAAFKPPQRNSSFGSTSSKRAGGRVQVGATPVPLQTEASQVVNSGQSQSPSQVQPIA